MLRAGRNARNQRERRCPRRELIVLPCLPSFGSEHRRHTKTCPSGPSHIPNVGLSARANQVNVIKPGPPQCTQSCIRLLAPGYAPGSVNVICSEGQWTLSQQTGSFGWLKRKAGRVCRTTNFAASQSKNRLPHPGKFAGASRKIVITLEANKNPAVH